MHTGRIAFLRGPGQSFEIDEFPVLPPEPDQALVRVTAAGVCGSDLHMWRGEMPFRDGRAPASAGHEMAGRVAALGRDRTTDSLGGRSREGDRVAYAYFTPCGTCWSCLNGTVRCPNRYAACEPLAVYAPPHFHGAYADYYVLRPGQWIFSVPDDLPDDLIVPVNCAPAQVPYALHRVRVCLGDAVLVQGPGGLGATPAPWPARWAPAR